MMLIFHFFQKHQKYTCKQDEECVLSTTDVEDSLVCVHSDYYQKAKKVYYQYLPPNNIRCACQNQRCVLKESE